MLSRAAISTSNIIPGISDDLYRFYYDVIKPRKLNLVACYIRTLDIDLHEFLEYLKSPKSVSTPIKGIFETSVKVGSQAITVRGNVVDGAVKIGTAFTP